MVNSIWKRPSARHGGSLSSEVMEDRLIALHELCRWFSYLPLQQWRLGKCGFVSLERFKVKNEGKVIGMWGNGDQALSSSRRNSFVWGSWSMQRIWKSISPWGIVAYVSVGPQLLDKARWLDDQIMTSLGQIPLSDYIQMSISPKDYRLLWAPCSFRISLMRKDKIFRNVQKSRRASVVNILIKSESIVSGKKWNMTIK